MIQSSEPPHTSFEDCHPPLVLYSTATLPPAASFLLRDKYVQILVLTASPPAVEGKGHSSAVAGLNKEKCLVSQAGLRRGSGAVRGGLDKADGAGGSWCGSSRRGRRGAGLNLGLELGHLLRAGQGLQQSVLLLQLGVALNQLFDLLLQDFHLLTHSVHQVAFHQVLTDRRTALEPVHLIHVKI